MLFIVQPITVAGRRLRRVGRSGRLEKLVWKQKDNIKSGACCDRDLLIFFEMRPYECKLFRHINKKPLEY